jgi:probable rRNA maturation factor
MPVQVAITVEPTDVPIDRKLLRAAVRAVLSCEGVSQASISLALVGDATSERINRRFLNHAGPTDVITFPLGASPLQGELVICADVAARVAAESGHAVAAELALYAVHGLLHLCGYDDKSRSAAGRMRERERFYLRKLNLPPISPPAP